MVRPLRLEYAGAFYHVFNRGNRREITFRDEQDYKFFQMVLIDSAQRCNVHLFAWCLMPNHFHLVLRTPEANVSVFMRRLMTRYAMRFNRRHGLVGHVFQGRYKAVVCEEEAYFLQLIRYVHQNPLGKGKRPLVSRLDLWPWSSHPAYCAAKNLPGTNVMEGLKRFGARPSEAVKNYLQFIGQLDASVDERFESNGIYGSDLFIEEAKVKGEEGVRGCQRALAFGIRAIDLVGRAEKIFGLQPGALAGASSNQNLNRIRKCIAFIGRKQLRLEATALGRAMGRGVAAISRMVARVERKGGVESEVQILIEGLKKMKSGVVGEVRGAAMCKR